MEIFGKRFFEKKKEKRSFKDRNYPQQSYGSTSFYPFDIENPTVTSAINLIAGTIAKLPVHLYFRKNDDSRIRATFHPLYNLLKRAPNDEESVFTFKIRLVRYLLKNGNAYIYKQKNGKGEVTGLYFMRPEFVQVIRDGAGYKKFVYNGKDYTAAEVLHIPALDYDGLVGHAPLESARYAVELGNTLDEYAKNSISNGVNSGLMIDTTDYLAGIEDPDEYTSELNNIARYYANHNAGPQNAGKPFLALPKTKVEKVDFSSNRDAQLQESRDFQTREIVKLFNLPLAILSGDMGTGSQEAMNQLFLSFTLSPWIKNIESYLLQLLTPFEQERYYFEFSTDPILTVETAAKYSAYRTGIESGILSINEVRAKENLPALDEVLAGNTHFAPVNVAPLTDENINAYFAQSKVKLQQLKKDSHNPRGDDRT